MLDPCLGVDGKQGPRILFERHELTAHAMRAYRCRCHQGYLYAATVQFAARQQPAPLGGLKQGEPIDAVFSLHNQIIFCPEAIERYLFDLLYRAGPLRPARGRRCGAAAGLAKGLILRPMFAARFTSNQVQSVSPISAPPASGEASIDSSAARNPVAYLIGPGDTGALSRHLLPAALPLDVDRKQTILPDQIVCADASFNRDAAACHRRVAIDAHFEVF